MKNVYYIGKFQFDSYPEYKKGLDDVKKIKYISDEVNINEPGVALRLYTLIRQKDIKFKSVIGEDYLLYLSDLLADDYKELSEDVINIDFAPVSKVRKYAGIACIIIAVISFLCFAGLEYLDILKTRQMAQIKEDRELSAIAQYIADNINENGSTKEASTVIDEVYAARNEVQKKKREPSKKREILPKYRNGDLIKNKDFVGWVQIENTNIDYPIVQSVIEEPDYYLDKDIDGNNDMNGSIFMDSRNDFINRDQNIIIYGHNMKSGLMFGKLKAYKDKEYYISHKYINFDTLYDEEKYEIIAVCLAEVPFQDEVVFRYYDFLNGKTEAEFQNFVTNINQLNIFKDEAVNILPEDKLLTLSTCDRYKEDGRLFLIAKKI